ncbi:MAG TPA: hypothetical protein VFN49_00520 [Candidatus Aquilonibacter sp.]|nr:hypothetical protein [Candidatus Aquilonibacter sp.]
MSLRARSADLADRGSGPGVEQTHLIALGMMMLSPPAVSLPVKLLLFVMVDGWAPVCGGVATSFR